MCWQPRAFGTGRPIALESQKGVSGWWTDLANHDSALVKALLVKKTLKIDEVYLPVEILYQNGQALDRGAHDAMLTAEDCQFPWT